MHGVHMYWAELGGTHINCVQMLVCKYMLNENICKGKFKGCPSLGTWSWIQQV